MPARDPRPSRSPKRPHAGQLALLFLPTVLAIGGCVANSSNPTVTIHSATSDDEQASFELDIFNTGGRDLVITGLEYEVSHGDTAFPVASDAWRGRAELDAHKHATLRIGTRFTAPPVEPDSRLLHLRGELLFADKTGFLGLSSMDLTKTSFQADIEAAPRSKP